jgi:hypothetical protein
MSEMSDWMTGTGLDSDLKGDPRIGGGATLRFWMPQGTEKKIIFLTDADQCPVLWEHQFQVHGDWKNWATCLKTLGKECPICRHAEVNKGQFARYKGVFFTVIDTSKFTGRDGVEKSNLRKLLVAKQQTAEKLKKRAEKIEAKHSLGLRGALFEVTRTSADKSCNVGDDFDYEDHVDLDSFPESDELNYEEILAPDPDKAQKYIEMLSDSSSVVSSRSEGTSDTVKF